MFKLFYCLPTIIICSDGDMNYEVQSWNLWNYKDLGKYCFRECRSSALESSLRKLGVEKLSKEDVQKMQWETLEAKIANWIHFMRIAVQIYL